MAYAQQAWPQTTYTAPPVAEQVPKTQKQGQAQYAAAASLGFLGVYPPVQGIWTPPPQPFTVPQYPPEQCLPQPAEMLELLARHGQPRSLEEWEASKSTFFPHTATLPPGWTRAWNTADGRVLYCRLDGAGSSHHFPSAAAPTERQSSTGTGA